MSNLSLLLFTSNSSLRAPLAVRGNLVDEL